MKESIKNSVQNLRVAKGLTQEELATKVNVSRQTIISIEKGNYVPSVLLALKIAGVFGEHVGAIFHISYEK